MDRLFPAPEIFSIMASGSAVVQVYRGLTTTLTLKLHQVQVHGMRIFREVDDLPELDIPVILVTGQGDPGWSGAPARPASPIICRRRSAEKCSWTR